jgi:hypothetical protein
MKLSTYTKTEGVLYHYCPIESLHGILTSKKLWLTNIRYMNDSKEISWLYELAKRAISRESRSDRPENERKLRQLLLNHCDNLFLDDTFFPHFYCSCFSKNGDSLGQWRAYANDGKGVAIGFRQSYLESFVTPHGTRLADVQYRTQNDFADFKRHFDEACEWLAKSEYPWHDDQISATACQTEGEWSSLAPFCKNSGFSEEEEVRLVHVAGPVGASRPESQIGPLEHRYGRDVVVPYKTLPLEPTSKPIAKIVFGPRNRIEHNCSSISSLARETGFQLGLDQLEVSAASYGEIRRAMQYYHQPE